MPCYCSTCPKGNNFTDRTAKNHLKTDLIRLSECPESNTARLHHLHLSIQQNREYLSDGSSEQQSEQLGPMALNLAKTKKRKIWDSTCAAESDAMMGSDQDPVIVPSTSTMTHPIAGPSSSGKLIALSLQRTSGHPLSIVVIEQNPERDDVEMSVDVVLALPARPGPALMADSSTPLNLPPAGASTNVISEEGSDSDDAEIDDGLPGAGLYGQAGPIWQDDCGATCLEPTAEIEEFDDDGEDDDLDDNALGSQVAAGQRVQPSDNPFLHPISSLGATSMDTFSEEFFSIPSSLSNLRQELKGDYSVPLEPPTDPPPHLCRPLSEEESLSLQHYTAWLKSNGTVEAYRLHARVLSSATGLEILSLHMAKKLAQSLTDFAPTFVDMCPRSCIAYTGVYADKDRCSYKPAGSKNICGEPRWTVLSGGKKKARAQVQILPVMATIRALFANADTSSMMRHRDSCLKEVLHLVGSTATRSSRKFSDYGDSFIHQVQHEKLGLFTDSRDVAFAASSDGAQLMMKKQSNTWILILIILSLEPSVRYQSKNVIINFATPGPNSPGDIESFMWPLFQEMAIASEGLWMYDAIDSSYFLNRAWVVMALGDMLGSAKMNGLAGHSAFHGDRFSLIEGARSSLAKGAKYQYYPLQPPDTDPPSYNPKRPSTNLSNLPIRQQEDYWDTIRQLDAAGQVNSTRAKITKATGVSKLPGFAASKAFIHPSFFPLDPFHLIYENVIPHYWDIWNAPIPFRNGPPLRGDAVHFAPGVAKLLGEQIALAISTLPPVFCGPIRDPNLKRQSQYKIFEWVGISHLYIVPIGFEVGMDSSVLKNFSRLIEIVEFAMTIRPRDLKELEELQRRINDFYEEYEHLYIGGNPEFIHRSRLCVFQLVHLPIHIKWHGSIRLGSQATVERSIGEMGHKIRSRKAPFANLANIIYQRELVKILSLYYPQLAPEGSILSSNDSLGVPMKAIQDHGRLQVPTQAPARREAMDDLLYADLEALSKFVGIKLNLTGNESLDDTAQEVVEIRRWGKLRLATKGHVLSTRLSALKKARSQSASGRRAEWFQVCSFLQPSSYWHWTLAYSCRNKALNTDLSPPQEIFGHARGLYGVQKLAMSESEPPGKLQLFLTFDPFVNAKNILGYQRGDFDRNSVQCIRADSIESLVGIWEGCASKKTWILRKHAGMALLSAEERGLGDEFDEEGTSVQ